MNLTLPLSRNHFHPAWLLLPLPPLVAIVLQWFNENEAEFLILGLRAILLGFLVGVMAVLRFHGGAGPGLRLLKEMPWSSWRCWCGCCGVGPTRNQAWPEV